MRVDLSPRHARRRLLATLADLSTGNGAPGVQIHRLPLVSPGAAADSTLVTIALQQPPAMLAEGVLVLMPLDLEGSVILQSGDAAWARFVDGAGDWVMDTDVGLEGSDAVVWLRSLTLRAGGRCPLMSSVIG